MEEPGAGLGKAGGATTRGAQTAVGRRKASGGGAGGPPASADFGETEEKEAVSTDSQGDASILETGIFQFDKVGAQARYPCAPPTLQKKNVISL